MYERDKKNVHSVKCSVNTLHLDCVWSMVINTHRECICQNISSSKYSYSKLRVSMYKQYTRIYMQPIPPYYYAAVTYIVATEHMATLYTNVCTYNVATHLYIIIRSLKYRQIWFLGDWLGAFVNFANSKVIRNFSLNAFPTLCEC